MNWTRSIWIVKSLIAVLVEVELWLQIGIWDGRDLETASVEYIGPLTLSKEWMSASIFMVIG